MADIERTVAGIRCSEVLEVLSDYIDGELPPAQVQRVTAHVQRCDWCERFGGRFAGIVTALRRELAQAEALTPEVESRLRAALDQV